MREIEFRGRPSDMFLDWAYGDFITLPNNTFAIKPFDSDGCINVVPETVGQYTGVKDVKGTKIFEGDIVEVKIFITYTSQTVSKNYIVVFRNGCFMYENKDDKRRSTPFDGLSHNTAVEVLGNIHDNKDL